MIGKTLRKIREIKGLSQKQLADMIGVAQSTVSDWEINENEPSFDAVLRLAKALEMSICEFAYDPSVPEKPVAKRKPGRPRKS